MQETEPKSRKLAMVTGGCRRLGAVISAALGHAGYDLILHSSPASAPSPWLVNELSVAGASCTHLVADLGNPDEVEQLGKDIGHGWGRPLAVFVNNAAQFEYDTPNTVTSSSMVNHYAVNCVAPVVLSRAAAEMASSEHRLTIINVLDQRIASPNGDQFSYTLSKIALAEATSILARCYAPNVRVSAVAPGLTLPTPAYTGASIAEAERQTPLRNLPAPSAIADAVLYLAGAASTTGQILFVDGGAHLRHYERDFLYLER